MFTRGIRELLRLLDSRREKEDREREMGGNIVSTENQCSNIPLEHTLGENYTSRGPATTGI